jgi:hypothetical protein
MANFAPPPSVGNETVSTGILKKSSSKEHVYVGTWSIGGSAALDWNGFGVTTTTLNNYSEYVFFGTGFDLRWYSDSTAVSTSVQMSLQSISTGGSLQNLTAANFSTASFSTVAPAGVSFNSTTGILNQRVSSGTQPGCSFSCSNLPLGVYKVRMTNNASGQLMLLNGFDVITPIHSPVPTVNYDQQNTLPIGSCSLSDNRKTSAIKETHLQKKNIAQATGVSGPVSTTSSSLVPLPELSLTHLNTSGKVMVHYSALVSTNSTVYGVNLQVVIDGVPIDSERYYVPSVANFARVVSYTYLVNVSPGVHKFDVYWRTGGGATASAATNRSFTVQEV